MAPAVDTEETTPIPAVKQAEAKIVLSQRDYRPTPYRPSEWEVVGERFDTEHFISLDLQVLRDDRALHDPMFEEFPSAHPQLPHGAVFTTPGGDYVPPPADGCETPAFDLAMFEAELQARFEEGRLAGLQEGAEAAEARVVEQYEKLGAQVKSITDNIHREVREAVARMEERALNLSLEIARKIIHTTVELKPDYIVEVIRKALGSLGAANPLRVRVSSQDYEFIELIGLPPELSEGEVGVSYIADPAIQSGCVVESDFGELNLELDKMWEEVVRALTSNEE